MVYFFTLRRVGSKVRTWGLIFYEEKNKLLSKELLGFEERQKIVVSISQKGYEFDVIDKALKELY